VTNFYIRIESYAIYALTEREYSSRSNHRDDTRWQMLSAGSRGQAMGMGWQLRNSPLWRSSAPQ
jgi:hypothetical protein